MAQAERSDAELVLVQALEPFPCQDIVWFSETQGIDLIVISSRGRSGLSRWLMGSVADRVARGASVPVLLVRAEKGHA